MKRTREPPVPFAGPPCRPDVLSLLSAYAAGHALGNYMLTREAGALLAAQNPGWIRRLCGSHAPSDSCTYYTTVSRKEKTALLGLLV